MSLLAIVIAGFHSSAAGKRLLYPLLLAGVSSVLYWAWSEQRGAGDLRAYGIVMFLPLPLIAALVLTADSPGSSRAWLGHAFWLYALAKLAEWFDAGVFSFGGILSGHSLKHIFAGAAACALLPGMNQRRARD
jgi:hypothetical protein